MRISLTIVVSFLLLDCCLAALNTSYTMHKKHADTVDGYFTTPHQIKMRGYANDYKIIDANDAATVPVATQVGFAASTETADVYLPENYQADIPIGIYIHMNSGDTAYMPTGWQRTMNDAYCIGASPDHAGNNRHDMWRVARALDLVASLKDQYNIDESRIYIGGFSGGALIAALTGMIYPDVFQGVIPTEHVMHQEYWGKVWTLQEITEMASNKQRWSFIIGADYAAWWFEPKIDTWSNHGFKTQRVTVPGMTHQQPAADNLANAITWVDAPAQRQQCKTYSEWLDHSFDTTHSTANRGPTDDFDSDGINNLREYLLGLDPTETNTPADLPTLWMDGKKIWYHYRRAALDGRITMAATTDLSTWDETGNNINDVEVNYDSDLPAFADCSFLHTDTAAPKMFFKPQAELNTLVNFTQQSGAVATQLTTGWDGPPELAIDGNRDPLKDNGSVTHTDTTSANWWQVDLGADRSIQRIALYNRFNHQQRLSNFRISILDSNGTEIVGKDFFTTSGHAGGHLLWDLPAPTSGRTVKVSTLGNNRQGNAILSLAEVEVLGTL